MILKPKNTEQKDLINIIDTSIITLCKGVAGSGKSHVIIGKACEALLAGRTSSIIITRPIVECGIKGLGYLKGNIEEKIEPYMRPMKHLLSKFINKKELSEFLSKGIIELAPLDYMRGMTYDNTYMILDEAQNATYEQIKMFLTRIGENSKIIINGDTTQRDIIGDRGLAYSKILNAFDTPPYVDGINIIELFKVVRHDIIKKILDKLGD